MASSLGFLEDASSSLKTVDFGAYAFRSTEETNLTYLLFTITEFSRGARISDPEWDAKSVDN